ncbi:MAG TPA: lytic transglycosylase domain-containing protein [Thermoanaerobaculia bacterium]|nr:lytic transglycosylase domain-containing protein [Thermoanaerobaculia bacterium]
MQRKRAFSTLFAPVLSQVRQLGRGSNTFCVGTFALSLVNLSTLGMQPAAPALPAVRPPALQAHAAAPAPATPATSIASPTPATAAPAPTVASPLTAAPAPVEAPKPAVVPQKPTVPAVAHVAVPKPEVLKPVDEVERLRKAADLLVQVNTALGEPQSPYGKIIYDVAIRHSINPHLVAALIHVESSFNPRAVSPKGAYGLMQLLPETARRFGLTKKKDLYDPKKNLEAGVRYLKWLANRFGGDAQKILAAYNAGEGAVQRFGGIPPYQETQSYVQKIFGLLGFSSTPAPAAPQTAELASAQDSTATR